MIFRFLVLSASITVIMSVSSFGNAAVKLTELDDEQLSAETGQALLNMAYTAPSGSGTGASNLDYGYYKLGLQAKLELNANIRNLQLGCGGVNGPGACDIDISNLALSGAPDRYAADGTGVWDKGRASSDAIITNPFLEFAIKNPNSASTREVMGFRAGAQSILGLLTAGTVNQPAGTPTTDGIKTFSGYMTVAATPVNAKTANGVKFGLTKDQMIFANTKIIGSNYTAFTNVNAMKSGQSNYVTPPSGSSWGINVAQQNVNFIFPQTTVTGNRMSQLNLVVNNVPIPTIAIGANDGALYLKLDEKAAGLVDNATFFMGKDGVNCAGTTGNAGCSYITNLKANVSVKEDFKLIHNLPLSGTGGYLSLQKTAMRWPGSNTDDIAQPGWWMSFAQPLNFGALNPTQTIPMDDVLPQISRLITDFTKNNVIDVGLGSALGALFGAPIYQPLGNIDVSASPVSMALENLAMDNNQAVVPNCYGGLTFC